MGLIDNLRQDLGYAIRHLSNNPRFACVVVIILALGIGANTAVFSVVNRVLLQPLAYSDPDRIVAITTIEKNRASASTPMSNTSLGTQIAFADFEAWRAESTAFEAIAAYSSRTTTVMVGTQADSVQTSGITPDFFKVFGIEPLAGRTPGDETDADQPVAVVGRSFWFKHFGANTAELGKTLRMAGRSMPIVGVMPAGFGYPDDTEVWFTYPHELTAQANHGLNYRAVARLKDGVTLDQGQQQLSAVSARLEQQYPDMNIDRGVAATRLRDSMVKDLRITIYVLWAAVGVVLLVACANAATLLLARSSARTQEIAVRAAMGATRGRVVRQLLTENLLLALIAGGLGVFVAQWGIRALIAVAPANVPRLAETTVDGDVLAFAIAVSAVTSVAFGLIPSFHASKLDLNEALKQGTPRLLSSGKAARNALVMAEIALSVLLLCAAGLLIRSFASLNGVSMGFSSENVLLMEARASLLGWPQSNTYFERVRAEIGRLPEVVAVGATMAPPGRIESAGGFWPDRMPPGGLQELVAKGTMAVMSIASPGLFKALGIPIKAGRDFDARDSLDAPRTVIINETLARKAFPGADPVGRSIICLFDSLDPMTVVGVVGDVRQAGPAEEPRPECYMSHQQVRSNGLTLSFAIRTTGNPTALAASIRRIAHEASPEVAVDFRTMDDAMSENVAAPRFRMLLLGVFAVLAVGLAMAGVYSVVSYAVGQRAREIGLRMAMGATPQDMLTMVLKQGFLFAAIGIPIGLAGGLAASQLLTGVLFGIEANDPLTYAGVCIAVTLTTLLATYIPARRAASIDPMLALRQ